MTVLAWHFLCWDYQTAYGRRRKNPLKVGDVMRTRRTPILCEQGLHASRRMLDALHHAPGPILCRVKVGGEIVEDHTKMAGQTRRILAMADVSQLLHEFACAVAEETLRAYGVTDEKAWEAIAIKRRWLQGEGTDSDLMAAHHAAMGALRDLRLDDPSAKHAQGAAWSTTWRWPHKAAKGVVRAVVGAAGYRALEKHGVGAPGHPISLLAQDQTRAELNRELESRILPLMGLENEQSEKED